MKKVLLFSLIIGFLASCDSKTATMEEKPSEIEISDTSSEDLTIPHSTNHEERSADCVFNRDTVTDDFVKEQSEFGNYTWDNESKEARIILENGDSLYIHVGGCQHYGVSATLTKIGSDEVFSDHSFWIGQALWIAERVKGFEPSLLKNVDGAKNYDEEMDDEGLFIDFHENDYTLIVDRKDGYTHVTLNHYFH